MNRMEQGTEQTRLFGLYDCETHTGVTYTRSFLTYFDALELLFQICPLALLCLGFRKREYRLSFVGSRGWIKGLVVEQVRVVGERMWVYKVESIDRPSCAGVQVVGDGTKL